MPVATVKRDLIRRDLRTVEGGWVDLRPLSYDEVLERRDGGIKILMEQAPGKNVDSKTSMQIANKWSNHFTFPRCVAGHNLTDENGVALDFSKPEFLFKFLDPKIGSEIEELIDELNQEDEDVEDFPPAPNLSLLDENGKPSESSEAS